MVPAELRMIAYVVKCLSDGLCIRFTLIEPPIALGVQKNLFDVAFGLSCEIELSAYGQTSESGSSPRRNRS